MPPATAMWLSLIRMASSRPKRWLKPPPQRTAYFSSARSPGVVLRVQQKRVRVPAMRRTNSCVAVAMPDRWPRKLSATRSAARTARAGPATVISAVLAATLAPSRCVAAISMSGRELGKVAATSGRPAITPASRATTTARARRVLRDGGDRGDVAGAAEVLGRARASPPRRSRAATEEGVGAEQGGGHGHIGRSPVASHATQFQRPVDAFARARRRLALLRYRFKFTIRSTERRAFSAIAGSITTSSLR